VWKKKENESPTPEPVQRPEPPAAKPAAPPRRAERAIIGPTLRISGELTGEEEIVVQGQIDGKIRVKGQGVTVGKSGKVKADIHARTIRIEGQVRGDLFGEQEVVIETSGDVEGNLIAPSVRLENGSRFKGSIDMEQAKKAVAPPMAPKPQVGPGPTAGPPRQPSDQPTSPPRPTGPGPHNPGS
jgi:cytoskeletal protein CcmA (bactofilin family)